MTDQKEYTLDEAIEKVKEIGFRYEKQLKLAEAAARIERERKIHREAETVDEGR